MFGAHFDSVGGFFASFIVSYLLHLWKWIGVVVVLCGCVSCINGTRIKISLRYIHWIWMGFITLVPFRHTLVRLMSAVANHREPWISQSERHAVKSKSVSLSPARAQINKSTIQSTTKTITLRLFHIAYSRERSTSLNIVVWERRLFDDRTHTHPVPSNTLHTITKAAAATTETLSQFNAGCFQSCESNAGCFRQANSYGSDVLAIAYRRCVCAQINCSVLH